MQLDILIPKLQAKKGTGLLMEQLNLYRSVDFENYQKPQQDMLLFQWGIYDCGDGELFELDVTRQLSGNAEDEIEHCHCTLFFKSNAILSELGEGNIWCQSLQHLKSFESIITQHPAFISTKSSELVKTEIEVEYV